MSFASFTARLNLNIKDFSQKLDKAGKQLGKFAAQTAGGTMKVNKNFAQYGATIAEATNKLHKHNFGLKDTARIVQGILVSQAFYTMAGTIRDATAELWKFNESLDYAEVTYSALFGSKQLGTEFLATLREHAESTIFSYEQLADSSKKLLAYNIPYENLMYVMEGLTNLGAMSGDAAALDRIALALGQIYTKGKLGAEEMRQLANAYVPIYEIVQEKFGLSGDDMKMVGNLNLPAADVINAVVDYANEKFGSVGDAAMMTITGLKQKISDSLKNLGVDILKPVTVIYKSLLVAISEGTAALGKAFQEGGLGGVFEHLVPDENMQVRIRQFFANIQALFKAFLTFMHSVGQVLKSLATSFMDVFNVLGPVINYVANLLVGMIQAVTSNATALRILTAALAVCAGAWVLFKAQALGAIIITALSKAIYGVAAAVILLSRALAASPIVTGLLMITVALAALAAMSERASNAISNLFNKLTAFNGGGGGLGRGGVLSLQKQLEGASASTDKFKQRLQNAVDSIKDAGDAAGDAGKKANKAKKDAAGLLSFDEVFKLNAPQEEEDSALGSIGNIADDLGGILDDLGDFGAGLTDSLMPDIPDFSDFASDFFGDLGDSLLAKLSLAGLGALIANSILKHIQSAISTGKLTGAAASLAANFAKALMGAFIGYGFDALASLLTDKLWKALENALGLEVGSAEQASFGATLGSILGGAIGMLVGGLPGSLIGAAIGHLAGGVVGLFWQTIDGAFNNTAIGFGTGILSAIAGAFGGTIKQLPSLLSASTFSGFFKNLADLFTGTGLKALAKGGLIGAAIGFVTDAIAALLWDKLAEVFKLSGESTGNAKVGQTIGSVIGTVIGGILGGPPGALIGSAVGTFAGGFVGLFWEKITEFFKPVTDVVADIAGSLAATFGVWWEHTSSGFESWWSDTSTGFTTWFANTTSSLSKWWSDTTSGFGDWLSNTISIFSDWDSITGDTLGDWWSDTTSKFSDWWDGTTGGFTAWKSGTLDSVTSWAGETVAKFAGWVSGTRTQFDAWKKSATSIVTSCMSELKSTILRWITEVIGNIGKWVQNVVQHFNDFKNKVLTVIGGFATAAVRAISQVLSDIKTNIQNWFKNLISNIATWWNNLWNPKNWKSGWDSIKEWFSSLFSGISNWFSNLRSSVTSWWDGLWSNKKASVNIGTSSFSMAGHAAGGIFNKEHIARFAEGNKAEAIIPLENASAMQPFVDAVARGIIEGLAPTLVQSGSSGNNEMPPMYVGTLIADDRGIKELYKRFEVIQVQENTRRGITPAKA